MSHPLAGLAYVATIHAAEDAELMHVTARHEIGADGALRTRILTGPAAGAEATAAAELVAEQGDTLVLRTTPPDGATTIVVLTLHSPSTAEIAAVGPRGWVRAAATVEALPDALHAH
jgi:hypothetical protein